MTHTEDTARLTEYGNELVAAGFEVWRTDGTSPYLQYRDPTTGAAGSLQSVGYFGEWTHYMPIVPSREFGSSMHLDTDTDPWTVEAARECARPTNRNSVVGTQRNAGAKAWRSPDAVALHSLTPTPAAVSVIVPARHRSL